jgi:catechol 2,3-dioxygenase-like lactoylglutathione lyase family enzyme
MDYMDEQSMDLGAFSVSLTVKDLGASRSFYEKLGFERRGGDGEHYLIMVNGSTVIGLFQGMFDKNILTFNPGLAQSTERVSDFERPGPRRHGPGFDRVSRSGRESDPHRSVFRSAGHRAGLSRGGRHRPEGVRRRRDVPACRTVPAPGILAP